VHRRQDHRVDADEALGLDAESLERPLVLEDARFVAGEEPEEQLDALDRAADAVELDPAPDDRAEMSMQLRPAASEVIGP